MNNRFLIISDLDGTLLNSKGEISLLNQNSIKKFIKSGGMFTFATGRMEQTTKKFIKELNLKLPIITYNGGRIYCPKTNEILINKQKLISHKIWDEIIKEKNSEKAVLIYQNNKVLTTDRNNVVKEFEIKENISTELVDIKEVKYSPVSKVLIIMTALTEVSAHEKLRILERRLLNIEENLNTVFSETNYLELLPEGVTKGKGVEALREYIDMENYLIVAIGDNFNDIELLKSVDYGIAVQNAQEELKKVAWKTIEKTNDENAIEHIIENIIPNIS